MSKSYRKNAKAQFATGTNTEYYRERNRNTRNFNKQNLRNTIKHYNEEYWDDELYEMDNKKNPNYDSWNEPTDGTYIIRDKNDPYYEKLLRK